jgi:hypothetical protein
MLHCHLRCLEDSVTDFATLDILLSVCLHVNAQQPRWIIANYDRLSATAYSTYLHVESVSSVTDIDNIRY